MWGRAGEAQSESSGCYQSKRSFTWEVLSFKHRNDVAMCQHSIHQGKPWGRGESPHGFFVLLHKTALVSLPVGTDPHQILQSNWHLFHRATVHLSMYTAKS